MNICILSGSPHKYGNTMRLVERYTAGANTSGHAVAFFDTVRMDIRPCMGCMACKKKNDGCIQHDDMEKSIRPPRTPGCSFLRRPCTVERERPPENGH